MASIINEFVTIFLPANNEEANLPKVLTKINNALRRHEIRGEILVVDDGSTDNTPNILDEFSRRYSFLKYVRHSQRMGIAQCFSTAFEHAKGEIMVFLPSDLQSNPEEDIPKLLGKMAQGYDLVCGVRRKWGRPLIKVIESKGYSVLSRLLFGAKIRDFNWIRAFKTKIAKDIKLKKGWHRYFVIMAAAKGYKIGEVPVTEYPRRAGGSKFKSFSRIFTGFIDMLAVKFYLSFSEKPLHFFSIPGILSMLAGIGIGAYLFVEWLFNLGEHFQLYLLAVLFFLTGVQLIAIGFVAEMVATLSEKIEEK
jgi:glycosyltransferase involved in cell wall biosynthesis